LKNSVQTVWNNKISLLIVQAGIAGALAQMTLGEARSAEQIALEEHMRKQSWEQGQIDYMGRDSFDNIWKKICETLSLAPQCQPTPPKEEVILIIWIF
jgi:glycogenin glucosyltransferase